MAADQPESSDETRHLGPQERPSSDGSGETFQEFLETFWREHDSGRTRTLRDYLDAFPGHEEAIAEVFVGARKQTPTAEGMVGPYRLIKSLGSGGQGEVFLAEDTRVKHRRVALKLIRRDRPFDPRDQLRMRREAEALAALDDPGICTVHELGEHEGSYYIAMQLIEGQTLGDVISTARMRSRTTRRGSPETEAYADFEDENSDGLEHSEPEPHSREDNDDILKLFARAARSLHVATRAALSTAT